MDRHSIRTTSSPSSTTTTTTTSGWFEEADSPRHPANDDDALVVPEREEKRHRRQDRHEKRCSVEPTALHTTVPVAASGAFNPLHGVLCILRSLYFCSIGPRSVFGLATDTRRSSNCSPKPLYSRIRPATPRRVPVHCQGSYGTVALCCVPFQDSSWHWDLAEAQPAAPKPTVFAGIQRKPIETATTHTFDRRTDRTQQDGGGATRAWTAQPSCCYQLSLLLGSPGTTRVRINRFGRRQTLARSFAITAAIEVACCSSTE